MKKRFLAVLLVMCLILGSCPIWASADRQDGSFVGRLSGTITDAITGQPLSGVKIYVYQDWKGMENPGYFGPYATTDEKGKYSLSVNLVANDWGETGHSPSRKCTIKFVRDGYKSLVVLNVKITEIAAGTDLWGRNPNDYKMNPGNGEDYNPGDGEGSHGKIVDSGKCGENVHWTLFADGTLSISGTGKMYNYGTDMYKVPPWYRYSHNEYTITIKSVHVFDGVTTVGQLAFWDCRSLTSVILPNSVISIERAAFEYCQSLVNITLPNSIISIGSGAFWACQSLANITLSNSLTSIGADAFRYCDNLVNITLPRSLTSIGASAFHYCFGLTSVTIPDSVTQIGVDAFRDCRNLTSVTIPDSVNRVSRYAFSGCNSLVDVYYSGTREQWKQMDIDYDNWPLTSATIHYNSTGPDSTPTPTSTPTVLPTIAPIPTDSPKPTTNPTVKPTTPPQYDTDLTQLASQWTRAYDQYTDSIKTTLEKNAGAAVHGDNLDNLARKLESNYGAVAIGYGLTKEQKVVVYKALLKMLAQETGYQLDFSDVNMSKLDKVPSAICKAVANGIGSSTYTYTEAGGKKVEISLSCNFGTNFGLANYYEKGKFVNSVVISTTKKDVEKIVSDYMTDLLDMEADALQQAAKEAYKDLSKAFFGATPDSFSKKIVKSGVEKISAKLARYKLGNVAKIAANCYNYYQFIKGIQNGDSTEKLLSMLAGQTDITFSDPNAKEIATQKALKLMEKTRKEIEKKLKKEPTGIDSFFAKALGWRVSDLNCPINIAVYDGANNQVGYIGDSDEWFDEEIIYIERNGDTKTIYSKEPVSFKVTGTDYGTLNYTVEEFKNGVPVGRTNFFDIDLYEGINIDISVPDDAVSGNSLDMVVDGTTYLTLDNISADEYDTAKVTIKDYAESSVGGIVSGFGEYVKGDTVKLLAQANVGYVFLGWKDSNGNLIGVSPTLELIAKENSTYAAQFEKPANPDSSVNEPTATPGPTNSPDSTNPPEGHYVISYSPGDGSGTMSTGTATAGTSFTLPPCTFTPPAGKQFKAWLINGKEYNPGVAYLFTADTTVTAVWQAKDANPGDYENIILPFIDVSDTAWYIIPVKYVYANHLMNGYSSATFGPGHSLTRAQFAQIIYNLEGEPTTNPKSMFTDVKAGQWYANAVTWAAEQEIVSGIGNNQFAPNRHITREELATMLWRYARSPKPVKTKLDFADANKVSGFAKEAMLWANENGIMNGKGNGILDPKGKATRAEAAQMLMNYLVKAAEAPSRELTEDECWKIAIEYWDNQIVPGKTTVFHATKKETFDGKIYYHYYLKQKVNSYWSAIDYLFVDVSTGSRYFGVQRPEYKV